MRVRSFALVAGFVTGVASCGDGRTQIQLGPDGGSSDVVDTADRAADEGHADVVDAGDDAPDVAADAPADVSLDAVADAGADGDAALEAAPPDAPVEKAVDAIAEAPRDVATERPPATATWTIAPAAACTAMGAGCMDTGAVGGYQITASGSCPAASSVQLWFPGGAAAVAPGSYTVRPAAGILDVIAMPAGMVGALAERDEAGKPHARFWARAGTVTVTATGGARRVTFTGVTLKEETTGVLTTLAADVTCP